MSDKPWNSPTRKPYYTKGMPQNVRMRCEDCGGQFHERTQATKMDAHCFTMQASRPSKMTRHGGQYGLHHSWRKANAVGNTVPVFRRISDSVDDFKNYLKEFEND